MIAIDHVFVQVRSQNDMREHPKNIDGEEAKKCSQILVEAPKIKQEYRRRDSSKIDDESQLSKIL